MGIKKDKILVIEDSRINQEVIHRILGDEISMILVNNGNEALEKAIHEQPDLILLDIILPGLSGFDVLADLKKNDLTSSIPVIIISGQSKPEDEVKGLKLGAIDYITKPYNDLVVKTRIETQLNIMKQMRTIEELGFVDMLTNIPNRRQFDRFLTREWNRSIREKTPVALLMIDVDHFKIYNDTHGHQQGDVALQTAADAIVASLKRSIDIAARWGGEEFAVLLPNTKLDGAVKVAEEIRANVEKASIPYGDGAESHKVTISIGVSSMIPSSENYIAKLITQADKALYKAKDTGRNRVSSSDQI